MQVLFWRVVPWIQWRSWFTVVLRNCSALQWLCESILRGGQKVCIIHFDSSWQVNQPHRQYSRKGEKSIIHAEPGKIKNQSLRTWKSGAGITAYEFLSPDFPIVICYLISDSSNSWSHATDLLYSNILKSLTLFENRE